MPIRIEKSFELLSQQEWDTYLSVNLFDRMNIDEGAFDISKGDMPNLAHPRLAEIVFEHNFKVESLSITYAICKHYFDKGIPDKPWYKSPGDDGSNIQYMPLFKDEHWMRRYWFNYFSDTYYLKIFSVWDSVYELLNCYYDLKYRIDSHLKNNVKRWLRVNKPNILKILNDQRHIKSKKYRNLAAHGTSPATVTNTVKEKKDVWVVFPASGKDGKMLLNEDGRLVMKRVKAKKVVSVGAGVYTSVASIMKDMEEYAKFSGEAMQKILNEI